MNEHVWVSDILVGPQLVVLVKADIVEEKTDIAVAGLVLVMPTISSL